MNRHIYNTSVSDLTSTYTPFSGRAKVVSVVCANTSAAVVDITVTDSDSTTVLYVTVPANTTIVINPAEAVTFAKGMTFSAAGADVTVTIAHSRSL
jgi:hypothetical protein